MGRPPGEFDLAHLPEAFSERCPDADHELLRECRVLVLAIVAAPSWDPDDQLPNCLRAARATPQCRTRGSTTVAGARRRDAPTGTGHSHRIKRYFFPDISYSY